MKNLAVMAGVSSIEVKESLDELVQQLQPVETPKDKERLQVLYWLKQDKSPSIGAIATAIRKHRNTVVKTLEQLQSKVDQLLTQLTPEVIASVTGYSFILDALSALNLI